MMKSIKRWQWFLILPPVVLFVLLARVAHEARERRDWHSLLQGQMAEVHIERALYEQPGSNYFFVRVRIKNLLGHALGVDLKDRHHLVRPRAFFDGFYHPFRLDGIKYLAPTLAASRKQRLLAHYNTNQLVPVPPRGMISYYWLSQQALKHGKQSYANYNNRKSAPYFLIEVQGELTVTDGMGVEILSFTKGALPDGMRIGNQMIHIPTPVSWKTLPSGARVLNDKL